MISAYVLAFGLLATALAFALARSPYGVLMAVGELNIIAGCTIYPVFFYLGAIAPGIEGSAALMQMQAPGLETALHVLCYATGALFGYWLASRVDLRTLAMRLHNIATVVAARRGTWRFVCLLGLGVWGLYLLLVGIDVAFANAILARAGNFEGFEDGVRWLFLKTIGQAFLIIALCNVPFALRSSTRDWFFLAFYFLLVAVTVANFISRALVLTAVIAPLVVYVWSLRSITPKLMALGFAIGLGVPVLLYGKSFGFWINYLITSGTITDLVTYQGDDGFVQAYLRNVEAHWYAVQAGLEHFFRVGHPLVTWEPILAAMFGIIPLRALEVLGLEGLHYSALDVKLACVNSFQLGLDSCTAPPLPLGYSAYVLPFAGALLLGCIKFGCYGALESCWRKIESGAPEKVWIVYFFHTVFLTAVSLIPSNIALVTFTIGLLAFVYTIRSLRFGRLVSVALKPRASH